MKARYLTFFSYIGTRFRSAEKLWIKDNHNHVDYESVQGLMELALLKLKSLNYPKVYLSSRTDGGVHALNSSAHIDLERYGSKIYEPEQILYNLNKFFFKNHHSIAINKCLRVPDNFSARRNALSRTYLYRFAVIKKDVSLPDRYNLSSILPIEEWRRCHFLTLPQFDIEKFKEGAVYFPGYHDFSSFKKFDNLTSRKSNRRLLYSLEVRPGQSLVTSYSKSNYEELFDYWDVYFHGKAFVHNQIRRIMGALISVALGKLPPEEIKVMLQVPSKHSWPTFMSTTPPHGLYLCNIEYDPKDLIYTPDIQTVNQQTSELDRDCE